MFAVAFAPDMVLTKPIADVMETPSNPVIPEPFEATAPKAVVEVKNTRKSRFVKGLAQSFNEVKLYEQGKKELKNAKDLINELRDQGY